MILLAIDNECIFQGNLEVPPTSLLRPLGPFFGFSHSRLLFYRPLWCFRSIGCIGAQSSAFGAFALLVRIGACLRLQLHGAELLLRGLRSWKTGIFDSFRTVVSFTGCVVFECA